MTADRYAGPVDNFCTGVDTKTLEETTSGAYSYSAASLVTGFTYTLMMKLLSHHTKYTVSTNQ